MKRTCILFVLATFLLATSLHAQEPPPQAEIPGSDELVRGKGPFQETWMNPEADLAGYDALHLELAQLQFREVQNDRPQTTGAVDTNTTAWALTEEEQAKYRKVVADALADELARSKKFELVEKVGPNTLVVRASLLDVVSYVPPPSAGLTEVYPSAVGAATLRFDLIDGHSGEILARLEERSTMRPPGSTVNEVSPIPVYRRTMWQAIDLWSRRGASDLRRMLEKEKNRQKPGD